MTTAPLADKPLVDALVAIFCMGNDHEEDEHTLTVLRVIRRLRPDSPKLAAVEAQQLISCRDLQGARSLLEEADARNADVPLIKAMLALVLQQQKDGLWQAYADEARKLPADKSAMSIIECLDRIARGDKFEKTADAETAPEASVSTPFEGSRYMGVFC